jgi:nucleotide-binding universal stress UspA family protein
VVVGYDASPHVEEAVRRGALLRVVHAPSSDQERRAGERAVTAATAQITRRCPELPVESRLLDVDIVEGLVRQSRGAAVLVLGRCSHNHYASLPLGSVSQRLVAHSPCPTVIVGSPTPEEPSSTTPDGPVVLGVRPGESPTVVDFAFEAAALRGVPLHFTSALRTATGAPEAHEELEQLLLCAIKARPDVPVHLDLRTESPEAALVRASRGAGLLVTGLRLPRQRFALPAGRVTQRVLHRALCPVAVVPHAQGDVPLVQAGR